MEHGNTTQAEEVAMPGVEPAKPAEGVLTPRESEAQFAKSLKFDASAISMQLTPALAPAPADMPVIAVTAPADVPVAAAASSAGEHVIAPTRAPAEDGVDQEDLTPALAPFPSPAPGGLHTDASTKTSPESHASQPSSFRKRESDGADSSDSSRPTGSRKGSWHLRMQPLPGLRSLSVRGFEVMVDPAFSIDTVESSSQ